MLTFLHDVDDADKPATEGMTLSWNKSCQKTAKLAGKVLS
jgi:hypothetical protein